jgi:MraZ protein
MFRGRVETTIDSKGRVVFPVKFREVLMNRYDDRLIITNFDKCLIVVPYQEWIGIEERMNSLPMLKKEVNALIRYFISGAEECSIDKQGRILIPQQLREYAKLEKKIVLAGVLNRVEIWDKERWVEVIKKSEEDFDNISEVISQLGL